MGLLALTGAAEAATVVVDGGNFLSTTNGTTNGTATVSGGGNSMQLNWTVTAAGLDSPNPSRVELRSPANSLRSNILQIGGANNASGNGGTNPIKEASYTFSFPSPLDGLVVNNTAAVASDFVDWTVSWTGGGPNATLTQPGNTTGLYDLTGPPGAKLNSPFVSGTTFVFDNDGTPGNRGNGGGISNYSIDLPNGVTSVTFHQIWNDNTQSLNNERIDLDFTNVPDGQLIPEPSASLLALFGGLLLFWVRRRRR